MIWPEVIHTLEAISWRKLWHDGGGERLILVVILWRIKRDVAFLLMYELTLGFGGYRVSILYSGFPAFWPVALRIVPATQFSSGGFFLVGNRVPASFRRFEPNLRLVLVDLRSMYSKLVIQHRNQSVELLAAGWDADGGTD